MDTQRPLVTTKNKEIHTNAMAAQNCQVAPARNNDDDAGDECGSGSNSIVEDDESVVDDIVVSVMPLVTFYTSVKKKLLALVDPKRKQFQETHVNQHFYTLYRVYKQDGHAFKKRYARSVAPSRSLKHHVFKVMKAHLNNTQ